MYRNPITSSMRPLNQNGGVGGGIKVEKRGKGKKEKHISIMK